ncbi:unnamed protein product [Plutella xylostella]|uniref:(diamondback moth) hypothetical protein n=1 Tax=Plutella xylostella TaxID=51655 RepID=A0A8S4EQ53_PLUXY|nr:unnamed protein product [Plutella xylostella]
MAAIHNSESFIILIIFAVIVQLTCFPLEKPSDDDHTLVLRFKRQLGNSHIADHALVSAHELKGAQHGRYGYGQQHDTVIVNVPENNNNNYRNPNNNGGTTVVVVEEQNSRYPTGRTGYGYYRRM